MTLVVVTYSPGEHLESLLRSVSAASSLSMPVILVDNGSTDGSPERAVDVHGATLLRTGANVGYGRAVNLAAQHVSTPWMLVCNPDIVFAPAAVDSMLDAAARWPRAGAVGPLIREPDGSVYPSARAVPTLGRGTAHALLGRVWPSNPWTTAYRRTADDPVERVAGWLSGACLLVRHEAFRSVNGFDDRYFMYFEDVDLGERLSRIGWLNLYAPEASVTHVGGTTTQRDSRTMRLAHHRSAALFVTDRYPRPIAKLVDYGLRVRSAASGDRT